MKALYSGGASVPLSRAISEHRFVLLPLGVVVAVNAIVLIAVLLPLTRSVSANEARAAAALEQQAAAEEEYRQAEALREGQAQATTDLDRFYRDVLPANVSAARRLLLLKLQQMAQKRNVRMGDFRADTEEIRDSALERMTLSGNLTGTYENVRAFIYDVETAPDFVVIDNIVLGEGNDASAPLELALEVSTYYRVRGPAAGDGR